MNLENQDIYLISFGIFLFFLTIFVVARQISNRNKIPLKIDGNSEVVLEQSQIDFEDESADQQEIVGFYLFSIDGSPFSFEQLSNYFQNLDLEIGNSLDDIYSSITSMLENKKYLNLGKNAKEFVNKFQWSKIIEEYKKILN